MVSRDLPSRQGERVQTPFLSPPNLARDEIGGLSVSTDPAGAMMCQAAGRVPVRPLHEPLASKRFVFEMRQVAAMALAFVERRGS